MVAFQYIAPDALPALHSYKYSGVDNSLVAKYIMQPYWSRLVLLCPMWLAPNLITLLGLACVAINVAVLYYLSPDFEHELPSWVYYSFAVGLFAYTSMDAIDGKQARRTGTSGPLGELFDHGCDAINTTLGSIITAQVVMLSQGWRTLAILFIALAFFYCTTWETYHTGTLYLGYINGPVEGTLFLCFIYILTGCYGRGIWTAPVKAYLGSQYLVGPLEALADVPLNDLAMVGFVIMSGTTILNSLVNVYAANKTQKKSYVKSLFGIAPLVAFIGAAVAWLAYSPADILHSHLFVFELALGLDFAMLVARIIIAHLVHQPFPTWQPSLVLLVLIGSAITAAHSLHAGSLVTREIDLYLLYGYVAFTALAYAHMCLSVIDQLCAFLDINCLTIKRKKQY